MDLSSRKATADWSMTYFNNNKKKERNKNTHLFYPGTQVLSLGNSVFQLFLSFVPDWQKIEISGPKKEIAVEKKERRDITEK